MNKRFEKSDDERIKRKFDTVIVHNKYSEITEVDILDNTVLVNMYGNISCGYPRFLDDDIEGFIEIPYSMVGPGEFFVLRASGDSMVGAGIVDGDLLLIKKQSYANDGQIVVAVHDGDVTLKKIFFDMKKEKYCLHPENESYDDIILDEVDILGIAVKVVKDL